MSSDHSKHAFTILVNNTPFETSAHDLTGAQIKILAGVPSDYELFLVRGSETVPVPGDEPVQIHEREEFRAIPAGTFGGLYYAAAAAR